jgi:hypothetical protein
LLQFRLFLLQNIIYVLHLGSTAASMAPVSHASVHAPTDPSQSEAGEFGSKEIVVGEFALEGA